jgi:hypothetical protein
MKAGIAATMLLVLATACGAQTASPSPSDPPFDAVPIEGDGAPLEAGWVTAVEFDFPLAMRIGEGWSGAHLHGEYADIIRGEAPDFIFVLLGHPAHFQRGDGTRDDATTPEAAWASLRANPDLEVTDPQPYSLLGAEGLRADVSVIPGRGGQQLFGGGDGDLGFEEGWTLRLAVLAYRGELLLVGINAPTDLFADAIEIGQPVVDSLAVIEAPLGSP